MGVGMIEENNFPTVRQGSQSLLVCVVAIVVRILVLGTNDQLNSALATLATALGATHGILVAGRFAIASKWSADDAQVPITTTTTTTKQVMPGAAPLVPLAPAVQDMTVKVEGDINVEKSNAQ